MTKLAINSELRQFPGKLMEAVRDAFDGVTGNLFNPQGGSMHLPRGLGGFRNGLMRQALKFGRGFVDKLETSRELNQRLHEALNLEAPETNGSRRKQPKKVQQPEQKVPQNPSELSKDDIRDSVVRLAAEQMSVAKDKFTDDTHFLDDLGGDSLDLVEFIMEVEEEFDITIPDGEEEKLLTLGKFVDYVSKKLHVNR